MKKVFFIMIVVLSVASVSANAQVLKKKVPKSLYDQKIFDICKEVASSMERKDSTKIAISEFYSLEGARSPYSLFLNESITVELFKTGKFKILEKGRLERLLVEQKMELNGREDGEVARKVGKILDIKAILAGTIIEMASTIRVNARLIDTGTGIIIAASSVEIDKKMVMAAYPIDNYADYFTDANQTNQNQIQNQVSQPQIQNPIITPIQIVDPPASIAAVPEDQSFGKFLAKVNAAKPVGNYYTYEIAFTNTGEDEELDFVGAKVAGSLTELTVNGKSFPAESIVIQGGKAPNYTGKVMIKRGESKTVSFKFPIPLASQSGQQHLTILVKGKSFPQSTVLKLF